MSASAQAAPRTPWPQLAGGRAAPAPRLSWRPGRSWPLAAPADLGELGRRLRDAGVLDLTALELTGATVLLPYGMKLVNRFRGIVHRRLREAGLDEHEFPNLLPTNAIDPARGILEMDGRVLWAAGDRDLSEGRARAVLAPSGEPAIYTYWRKAVRKAEDLPIRMYRRGRYFRPDGHGGRSGRSVLMGIEAPDVFEAHCCLAGPEEAEESFDALLASLRAVCDDLHLPTLWSARPRSTNVAAIAGERVAGDVPLPTGVTAQISAVYDQGTAFSEPYGIRARTSGEGTLTPHHVTGYVSRRLLYAHLAYACAAYGRPLPHPDLAPVQATVSAPSANDADRSGAAGLAAALSDAGVRTELLQGDRDEVSRARRARRPRGAPIEALVLADRTLLVRGDSGEEVELPAGEEAVRTAVDAIADAGDAHAWRLAELGAGRLTAVSTRQEAREALRERLVVSLPLARDDAIAQQIGEWRCGEVLGWVQAPEPAACALTGEVVTTIGLLSSRL